MKHKRLFYTLTIILYFAVVLLSLTFLFSIKEIKCNYGAVSGSVKYEQIENKLSKYNGKNLLFVNTDKIASSLEKDTYIVVKKIKKDFPNKIIVEIEEREEIFIIESDSFRYYLDKDYYVLKKVDKQVDYANSNLILLDLSNFNDFNYENLKVGYRYTGLDGWIKNCIGEMISIFSDWKNVLNEVKVVGQNKILGYNINFKTKQGVEIEILDPNLKYNESGQLVYEEDINGQAGIQEVREVYKKYSSISDYEKTKGKLIVNKQKDNTITVVYSERVD